MTVEELDKIIQSGLHTIMKISDAKAHIRALFSSYRTNLRRNGLGWLLKENYKVAVVHVLSAVRPQSLKDLLESDLAFSRHALQKRYDFLAHSIKLSEVFSLVVSSSSSKRCQKGNRKPSGNYDEPQNRARKQILGAQILRRHPLMEKARFPCAFCNLTRSGRPSSSQGFQRVS